jgi:protein SCO1
MAHFAGERGADWTFLTGEKRIIDKVLKDLGSYSTNPSDHSAMLVIGDASTGEFIRAFGLPNPDFVAAEVRNRVAAHHHHH